MGGVGLLLGDGALGFKCLARGIYSLVARQLEPRARHFGGSKKHCEGSAFFDYVSGWHISHGHASRKYVHV